MFLLKIVVHNEITVKLTQTHTHPHTNTSTCYLLSMYRHMYCYIDRLVFVLTLPESLSNRNTHIYFTHTIYVYMYVHNYIHTHTPTYITVYVSMCKHTCETRAPFVHRFTVGQEKSGEEHYVESSYMQ